MAECSNCGRELPQSIDFDKERDIDYKDESVEKEAPCECGKMYKFVYSYVGLWDPEEEEYVTRK